MADLITRDEVKAILGLDLTDTRKDPQYDEIIPLASQAIKTFTGRDFGEPTVTEPRNFEYDGSGFLDIDDATDITALEFIVPHSTNLVLDSDQWYAAPPRRDDSPVYDYIVLVTPTGQSPYMGFERNTDVLYEEGRLPSVTRTAVVTGTWGWPDVPGDVKLATAWTINSWTTAPDGDDNLSAEAIEGFSRSWGNRTATTTALAIPNRARDILAAYQKTLV
jgi:hypothetical protein